MPTNKFQDNSRPVQVILTGTVSSGDVVILGKIIGIAQADGVSGGKITLDTDGIYRLAAINGTAFVLGDLLYWDGSELTLLAPGNTFIGVCMRAKGSSVILSEVKLHGKYDPSSTGSNLFASGSFTTVGGDATETITIAGVLATDSVHVTVAAVGSTPRIIITAIAIAGAITVTLADDPAADHVLNYSVMRG